MTWQLNRFVIPPVFAVYPTVQTNAILLYYNALTFVCYIPLLVALIVFYRFTALAFVDVQQLSREHLIKGNNGALWIRKARQKTNQMCNVPVLSIPQRILRKYDDNVECIKKGVLLPVISNQRFKRNC